MEKVKLRYSKINILFRNMFINIRGNSKTSLKWCFWELEFEGEKEKGGGNVFWCKFFIIFDFLNFVCIILIRIKYVK